MKRWLATPAANSAIFFTAASTAASRASGSPRPPPPSNEGGCITSSITLLDGRPAAAACPLMARFISQPVMISRLISLVPSKMRLMRASR